MHEKSEYDARIGGNVELPNYVQTFPFAADRVDEIQTLLGAINHPSQTKLVFQTLPKHMRRRAMSHNPKRLPRKYRQAHVAQMRKSGVSTIGKRPSRKYRRKASNLQKEYARRARNHIWLETHLWHAKRFHMVEKWGYKLAQSSCDKTFRSSYRASAEHCLLQDISYVSAIEIVGKLDVIREAFSTITSPKTGLGICAKTYVSGCREGTIELFLNYPFTAVGKVSFMWKPDGGDIRTVWLFVHASFYKDVSELFRKEFGLTISEGDSHLNPGNGLRMKELKDKLNRFRLTGPLSHAVLVKAFKCPTTTNLADTWFKSYIESSEGSAAHSSQSTYWNSIRTIFSPTDLVPNMVLALNIDDPRLNRPQKRIKAVPDETTTSSNYTQPFNQAALTIPTHSNATPLFDIKMRQLLIKNKVSTSQYCQLRNKHALVPGERCAFEEAMQPIPILLVQRPGCQDGQFKRLGYGGGWDVIVPAEYGISTWMCLIMWGARAGGLRETETVHREGGTDEFVPDTLPAKYMADAENEKRRNEFFKKPQNKRPNYTKLAIESPFLCRWSQLVKDWSNSNSDSIHVDFYVLREKLSLTTIRQILQRKLPFSALSVPHPDCLIPVHLTMSSRGSPDNCSIICLPKASDLKRNVRKLKTLDTEPVHTEPLRTDAHEKERKLLRSLHLKLLKRLRRRRVRAKRILQETAEKRVLIARPETAKLVAEQLERMRELWLPKSTADVRNQCSREVFGYLTQANFGLSEATVAGVGYITLQGLRKLVVTSDKAMGSKKGACQVLVRGTQTRHYRLASLTVLA